MSRQKKKRLLFIGGWFLIVACVIILLAIPFKIIIYYMLHFIMIAGFTSVSVSMIMHARDNQDKAVLRYKVFKMMGYALFIMTAAFLGIILFTLVFLFLILKV